MKLRDFQTRFLRGALDPATDTAALSLPRGNGKSWLAGHLLTRCMTPGDALHQAGAEYLLCAASIEQARIVYKFVRPELEGRGGYRFIDSATRLGITGPGNTKLRVLSSNGRTAQGIVGCPVLVADEPGSWEVNGGQLMRDAIQTAQGKPGSRLKVVHIGTLAPARGGWWHELVKRGSRGSVYVQALQGDPEKWDTWAEISRVNPLARIDAKFRAKLLEERDEARRDTRLKARFMSYRENVPTADESTVLLTVQDWKRVCDREAGATEGQPIVGVDLGGGRAWSAAVAVWRSGRVEALAVAPGTPSIEEQETRDRVPKGTYRRLVDAGILTTDGDRRVPRVEALLERVMPWRPVGIIADRFRAGELRDAAKGAVRVSDRVSRWSEAAEDIRALRKAALDGPLTVGRESRSILQASLAFSMVRNDDQGNTRLVKADPSGSTGRDDVAAALVLAAGAFSPVEAEAGRPISRDRRVSAIHHQPRWYALRRRIKDRDGWRCVQCGKAGLLNVDHRTPIESGGDPWNPANLQTLCRTCHLAKTAAERLARFPESPERTEWRRLLDETA